jgi:hypothetical protein
MPFPTADVVAKGGSFAQNSATAAVSSNGLRRELDGSQEMSFETFQRTAKEVGELLRRVERVWPSLVERLPQTELRALDTEFKELKGRLADLIGPLLAASADDYQLYIGRVVTLHGDLASFIQRAQQAAVRQTSAPAPAAAAARTDQPANNKLKPATFKRMQRTLLAIVESVSKFEALQLQQIGGDAASKLLYRGRWLSARLLELERRGEQLEDDGVRLMSEADASEYAKALEEFAAEQDELLREAQELHWRWVMRRSE